MERGREKKLDRERVLPTPTNTPPTPQTIPPHQRKQPLLPERLSPCMPNTPLSDRLSLPGFIFFLALCSLLPSISPLLSLNMSYVVSEKGSPFALDGLGGLPSGGGGTFAAKNGGELDVWVSLPSPGKVAGDSPAPYVHPLVRLSANSLSQMSLEMCTESLGSETGSDEILSYEDTDDYSLWTTASSEEDDDFMEKSLETYDVVKSEIDDDEEETAAPPPLTRRKKPTPVNYHCSSGRSPARSFPPPLPSISRRDGPCLSMRRRCFDGRLVVEAVPAPSQNYLHAQRHNGRLLLTFIDTVAEDIYPGRTQHAEPEQLRRQEHVYEDAVEEMAEEEEEVELVDRGIVVEVKVSRPQLLPQSGGLKVQLSSVVINKFVGVPLTEEDRWMEEVGRAAKEAEKEAEAAAAASATTATAVVAVAAAASSSLSADEGYWRNAKGQAAAQRNPTPEKLYFTSKGMMNRGDLLHQVRRCSELRRPLFIWEPCCVATS